MKGYFKFFLAFFLLFVPALVLAQFESSPLWDMFQKLSFDPKASDLSVAYLGKLFGAVPGVPQLSSFGSTIMGSIFGVFNAGILALSGVFLSYTITKVVTETTMDGAAMGKSTTIWTSVRCALSTSLLVPQASGYSLINGIVMWVVIQSVGLANLTWDRAMDYLSAGGITVSTGSHKMDYSFINWELGKVAKPNNVGAADVLQSLTCARAVHKALVASQKATHDRLLDKQAGGETLTQAEQLQLNQSGAVIPELSEETGAAFSIYSDLKDNGVYQFPYANTTKLSDLGLSVHGEIPELSGICGVISYGKSTSDKIYPPAKSRGLADMINLLDSAAKRLIDKLGIDPDTEKAELDINKYVIYTSGETERKFLKSAKVSVDKMYSSSNQNVFSLIDSEGLIKKKPTPTINWPLGTDDIFSAAAAYQVAIKNAKLEGADAAQEGQQQKYRDAKRRGWILAGSYYRLLTEVQDIAASDIRSHRLVGYKSPTEAYSVDEAKSPGIRTGESTAYMTLLPVANKYQQDNTNPVAVIDKDIFITLKKAMTWVQLTYPYAMLRAKTLESTATVDGGSNIEGLTFLGSTGTAGAIAAEVATYLAMSFGAGLLPAVPALGIVLLTPIPMAFLMIDVNKVFSKWQTEMGAGSITVDPIIKLQNLGETMLEQSMAFTGQIAIFMTTVFVSLGIVATAATWASIGLATIPFMNAAAAPQAVLQELTLITPMVQTIVFATLPIALAVLIPMFVSGVMLYIYVPLIPFMLFLFGVLSWFISVIVLMAAAPIICFLMLWGNSSQENPLLAREAEQFLMQIIGVFFRPTLMVIGLVAGVALSYIGIDVLNAAFNVIIGDSDLFDINSGAVFAKKIALVVVYTTTMISVVNVCFSPIHMLYSEAMRVVGISAPVVGTEERAVEGVKGSISHTSEAAGGGLKEGVGAAKGASSGVGEDIKERAKSAGKRKRSSIN